MRMRGPESQLDWLGVASLWLGALLLAIKSADIPLMTGMPSLLTSGVWNFIPLALITFALAAFLYRQFKPESVVIDDTDKAEVDHDPNWIDKLEVVAGRNFRNEEVAIDGKRFVNCEFHSVTLVYNGGAISFEGCTFGQHIIKTENPRTARFANFLLNLGHINSKLYTKSGETTLAEIDAANKSTRDPRADPHSA